MKKIRIVTIGIITLVVLISCKPSKTREQCEEENDKLRTEYMNQYAMTGVTNGSNAVEQVAGAGIGMAAGWLQGSWEGENCSKYPSQYK